MNHDFELFVFDLSFFLSVPEKNIESQTDMRTFKLGYLSKVNIDANIAFN